MEPNIYNRYHISEDGKCYDTKERKYLRVYYTSKKGKGKPRARYLLETRSGGIFFKQAHRLIAELYVPRSGNQELVVFKDGDTTNIHANNLIWRYHNGNCT